MADLEPLHVVLTPKLTIRISSTGVHLDEPLPKDGASKQQPPKDRPPPGPPTRPGGSPVIARLEILDDTDVHPDNVSIDDLAQAIAEGRPIIFHLPK